MITTAYCKETNSIIKITDYNPAIHKTILCNNMHPLTPKLGNIKRHHFAHQAYTDCNHKHKTLWHLTYQSLFPQTEITFPNKNFPKSNNTQNKPESLEKPQEKRYNIADILVEGTVIEIQHSPISREEIRERETVYEKMIWIFDVKNSITGTEFICQDQFGICILQLNKKYLYQTEQETYYDCGKYLCQKLSLHGKYALCKIVTYQDFAKKFTTVKSEDFNVLITDPDFEFAFTVSKLQVQINKIFFDDLLIESQDYSPFSSSHYFPNRYFL